MLSLKAVIVASITGVVGSVAALLFVVLLSQAVPPSHQLWFVGLILVQAFSMVGGFIVARVAGRYELAHAAVAALPYLVISVWIYPGTEFNDVMPGGVDSRLIPPTPAWHDTAIYGLILLIVPAALAGGYFARTRLSRTQGLPRVQRPDSFLSPLTYGAMVVWGVGETIDSIPSLIGLLGLGFMVYVSVVWSLALLLAIVSSVVLMYCGPRVHRRRLLIWYGLLVLVGLATSVGVMPRLTAEVATAAMATIWLVRTIRYAPPVDPGLSPGVPG